MNCPKRSETCFYEKIIKTFPELLASDKEKIEIEDHGGEINSLLESQLEFDPDVEADIVIKNAQLSSFKEGDLCDIAISGNIITRVGEPKEMAAVAGKNTRVIDAKGKSVIPGLTDSHLHLSVAMQRLGALNVEGVKTFDEFKKAILEYKKENSDKPVLYIFGLHYFDDPIIPANKCRHVLDDIVGDKPIIVYAHDLHTVWGNTKALEIAGLLKEIPPYPHLIEKLGLESKIVLDSKKIPTGEFHEPEVYYYLIGPVEAQFVAPVKEQLRNLKKVCKELASFGITSVHRMGLAQPAEDIAFLILMLELEQSLELPIRINTSFSAVADSNMLRDAFRGYEARTALIKARNKEITAVELHEILLELLKDAGGKRHNEIDKLSKKGGPGEKHPHMKEILNSSEHIRSTTHNKHVKSHVSRKNPHNEKAMPKHVGYHTKVRCDTIKIFMDGIIEKNTAFRLDKAPSDGIPEFKQKELNSLLEFADRLGMQVAAHSIGDASVRSMLDAISNAREKNKDLNEERGHLIPHRIEHIEICQKSDLCRFGKEHVVTSMQPLHERPPVTLWHELVPKEEWSTAFAWKDALNNGAVLVFGSDWPIVSCDVIKGINHAVTRKPWYNGARHQELNLDEAMSAYTTGAAFTEYSNNIRGEIRPGMLADIVILSNHITELENKIPKIDIEKTICDGVLVYERGV